MTRSSSSPVFEPLEHRTLLDAAFTGAGIAYQFDPLTNTTFAVVIEVGGTIDGAGVMTASVRAADDGGPDPAASIPARRVLSLPSGRYIADREWGALGEAETYSNARFLLSEGYVAGWSLLDYAGTGESQELVFLIEPKAGATASDFNGFWTFSKLVVDEDLGTVAAVNGTAVIAGSAINWTITAGDNTESWTDTIVSVDASGVATTAEGRRLSITADASTIVMTDLDTRDGSSLAGVMMRDELGFNAGVFASAQRHFRVSLALAGAASAGEQAVAFAEYHLRLNVDGTYEAFSLIDLDRGRQTVVQSGVWTIVGRTLRITEPLTGDVTEFHVGGSGISAGAVLLPMGFEAGGTFVEAAGLGTRAAPLADGGRVVFSTATLEGSGEPRVYELLESGTWRSTVLWELAGGPLTLSELVSWTDPTDGLTYAAGFATGGGLMLYRAAVNGTWTLRDLAAETGSGAAIARQLRVMISADGSVNLMGLTAEGALVRYFQTSGSAPSGRAWGFVNIKTAELDRTGQPMPAFAGDIVSYATSWGGLNIAGLDAAGDIWSVWWAPGQTQWWATNLSEAYDAAPLVGGLTVYLTAWNGINIAGINSAGELIVTWWVPSFGGEWVTSNLTADAGGPALRADSVSSYVSSWGGMNVAGVDAATGEVTIYWWAPDRTSLDRQWAITSLSAAAGGATEIPTTNLRGVAASDSSLNLLGISESGQLIRYHWKPTFGGVWAVDNLSLTAVAV